MKTRLEVRIQNSEYEGRGARGEGRLFFVYRHSSIVLRTVILFFVLCSLFSAIGCDAFVRKFTRKPKREAQKEELVLIPEDYKRQQISKEDLYRQYWLFWKSWHSELIDSLSTDSSHKKQIYCINEAIKNLEDMKLLLKEEKQKELGIYIGQLKDLKVKLQEDLYGTNVSRSLLKAGHIKRGILRDFSYNKISEDLSYEHAIN